MVLQLTLYPDTAGGVLSTVFGDAGSFLTILKSGLGTSGRESQVHETMRKIQHPWS